MDMVDYNDLVNETCEGQNILTEFILYSIMIAVFMNYSMNKSCF